MTHVFNGRKENLAFRRGLRDDKTDAENVLWSRLRGRKMGALKFYRQFGFDRYVLDFYCPEKRLAIEVDGGQHDTEEGREHDAIRGEFLVARGVTVIRFWNSEVTDRLKKVLEKIEEAIRKITPHIPPLG